MERNHQSIIIAQYRVDEDDCLRRAAQHRSAAKFLIACGAVEALFFASTGDVVFLGFMVFFGGLLRWRGRLHRDSIDLADRFAALAMRTKAESAP